MDLLQKLKIKTEPAPELENVFRNANPIWLGSDCAFSLPLERERVLWLFGDTFIADENSEKICREKSFIINSSIGIQRGDLLDNPKGMNFFWKNENRKPQSFFLNNSKPGFLWPLSAAHVASKLYVFTVRILQSNINEAFGFEQIGNEIACVENPRDEPDLWKMKLIELPFEKSGISFGAYALHEDNFLYIYGYRKEGEDWLHAINLMIARVDVNSGNDIADFRNWELLDGLTFDWTKEIQNVRPVMNHSRTELSVSFLPSLKKYVFVANGWRHPNPITIRLSDAPFGPFSQPRIVYHCPEPEWDRDYFCYAAKAHPELAREENELVISYMTNAKKLHKVIEDVRIYYPKFVRVKVG